MDLVANATSATAEAYGLPGGVSTALADVDRWHFVATATLCMELTFWLSIAFHAAVRASGWFEKYRIHHSQPPADAELLSRAWTDVMVGHLLIRPPLFFVVYPVLRRVLQFDDNGTQPVVLWRSALQLMVIIQIDDFLYYWVHRMLHHRLLYKHFHKQHHEFKNSVPIAAEVSSPRSRSRSRPATPPKDASIQISIPISLTTHTPPPYPVFVNRRRPAVVDGADCGWLAHIASAMGALR